MRWSTTSSAPSSFTQATVSGREAVAMTLRPASLASWMPIEPTPPAPPMMRIVFPASLPPRSIFMRSKNASQAVIAVSGMAAACAKSRRLGFLPTMRSSTRWNSLFAAGARDVAGVVHLVAAA